MRGRTSHTMTVGKPWWGEFHEYPESQWARRVGESLKATLSVRIPFELLIYGSQMKTEAWAGSWVWVSAWGREWVSTGVRVVAWCSPWRQTRLGHPRAPPSLPLPRHCFRWKTENRPTRWMTLSGLSAKAEAVHLRLSHCGRQMHHRYLPERERGDWR